MQNPVGWFEIYVNDMARAQAFYTQVFGTQFQKIDNPDTAAWPGLELWAFQMDDNAYGASGALVKMPGLKAGGNSVLVYFHCDDCAVETAKVVAAGGQIQREKIAIGQNGYIALVIDSEGNMIGLHSMQ